MTKRIARQTKYDLIEKQLAHLGAKVVDLHEGDDHDIVIWKSDTQYGTHEVDFNMIARESSPAAECYWGHYFAADQRAEAEADYFNRTKKKASC